MNCHVEGDAAIAGVVVCDEDASDDSGWWPCGGCTLGDGGCGAGSLSPRLPPLASSFSYA